VDLFDSYKILGSSLNVTEYIMNTHIKNILNNNSLLSINSKQKDKTTKTIGSKLDPFYSSKNYKIGRVKLKNTRNNEFNQFREIQKKINNEEKTPFLVQKRRNIDSIDSISSEYLKFINACNNYKLTLSMLRSTKNLILSVFSIIEK